jgi:UDP-N-acetylmuramyl pentapeptide phosphotransferase/UDP-N-acetylglucosamine-1-phosphate transferase
VHVQATPRVGGLAVAAGVVAGALVVFAAHAELRIPWTVLILCATPAFVWGLIEDLRKRDSIMVRLAITAAAAAMAFVMLDARITQLDVPGLDSLLTYPAFSFAFTVFAVTGVAHSFNVIDGLNGLAGITALVGAIGMALVAWAVGDWFVLCVAAVLAGSVAGFLLVNFPGGRIFLGDGGAYLVGLVLAVLSVLLVQRNSEVSPWFPLVLLAFPIWETIFSMYRRRLRGQSPGQADALHLHTLVYRRVARWKGYRARAADYVMRNSIASMMLWTLPLLSWLAAMALWRETLWLQAAAGAFAALYVWLYRRIVRFSVPAWMLILAATEAAEDEETDPQAL